MSAASETSIGRPKTFDRDRVIDVAMDSYWREGVENVSLNELCRRAEVSKPGVYREFGGEEGLLDAVLEHYAKTVLAPNAALVDLDLPFQKAAAAMIAMLTSDEGSGPVGCLLAQMQQRPQQLGPVVKARVELLRNAARTAYAHWVDVAKSRGEIDPQVSTEVAAAFIDIQCTTVLVQMSVGEDLELLRAQAALAFSGLAPSSAS